ncbi:sulfotransferase [Arthrobacter sp. H14]|uniref:sulfotransferase n=1 Tax=Arthrobacter sp. H14 TaxID=1312959 RepID=UPI0009DE5EAB
MYQPAPWQLAILPQSNQQGCQQIRRRIINDGCWLRYIDAVGGLGMMRIFSRNKGQAASRVDRRSDLRRERPPRNRSNPGAPLVLYIAGSGRSGSTLLERLLGQIDSVATLGEVHHLWARGIAKDESCGCGKPFGECEFWRRTGEMAFGGWKNVDMEDVEKLHNAVDRQRYLPLTMLPVVPPAFARQLAAYSGYYGALYKAVQELSGASVIVDSGKHPSLALALSHNRDIDLRIVHLVRDSRGVSFSWAKSVKRPESTNPEDDLMKQYSSLVSSALWVSTNLAAEALRWRAVPRTRLLYEDLIADPVATIDRLRDVLNLPITGQLKLVGPGTVDLKANHSVAGNPMRFRRGETTLRPDAEWRKAMTKKDRRLVSLLTAPMRLWYGYTGR